MESLIIFISTTLTPAIMLSFVNNNRVSDNLFISFTLYVFILFCSGIFAGSLNYGFAACIILSLASLIFCFYIFIKKKIIIDKRFALNLLFIFIVILFLLFINRNRYCWFIDEFTHWADIVKVMCNINDFGTNSISNSLFPNYPPGMALFQYLFEKTKICFGSGFADWGLYFSYQLFLYSAMLTTLSYFKKTKSKISLIVAFTFAIFCLDDFSKSFYHPSLFNPFISILIDPFLSILAVCGFVHILFGNSKNISYHLNLWSICLMLVLSKDAGLLYAVFICFLYIAKEFKTKEYFNSFAILLFTIGPKLLWSFEVNHSGVEKRFSAPVKLQDIIGLFNGSAPEYRYVTINSFLKSLVTNKINFNIFNTSYLILGVLLLLTIFAIMYKINKKSIFYLILAEYFIYVIGLLFSYLFQFNEYEATGVVCITRYLDIEYMILIILSIYLIIKYFENRSKGIYVNSILIIIFIVFSYSKWSFDNFIKGELPPTQWYKINEIRKTSDGLKDVLWPGSKVYIVSEGGDGFYQWLTLRYNYKDVIFTNNSIQAHYSDNDEVNYIEPDDWMNYLINNNYDFVYTSCVWQQESDPFKYHFVDDYGYLFSSGIPYDYYMYSINKKTKMLDYYFSVE